jgi:hypothetical protein
MLDPIVLAALIALLKRLAEVYLPQFPISEELINAVILFLVGLFANLSVRAGVRRYAPQLFERDLFVK